MEDILEKDDSDIACYGLKERSEIQRSVSEKEREESKSKKELSLNYLCEQWSRDFDGGEPRANHGKPLLKIDNALYYSCQFLIQSTINSLENDIWELIQTRALEHCIGILSRYPSMAAVALSKHPAQKFSGNSTREIEIPSHFPDNNPPRLATTVSAVVSADAARHFLPPITIPRMPQHPYTTPMVFIPNNIS